MSDKSFVSKLSTKTMGCNVKKCLAFDEGSKEVHWFAHIFGIAQGVKEKKRQDDKGDLIIDTPIIGQFEGTNLETGEIYNSSMLYLPGGIHETLESKFPAGEKNPPIQFAIQLGTRKASNRAGYEYVAKQIVKDEAADPLASLRNAIAENKNAASVKAIEGPSDGAKKKSA